MLYLTCLGHWGKNSLVTYLERFPSSSLMTGICGFVLMVTGPRLFALLAATISSTSFLWRVVQGSAGVGPRQQAAEYVLLMLLPMALAMLALLLFCALRNLDNGWKKLMEEFEKNTVIIFRWTALTTMFFAGFHKLNSDFLFSSVSCEHVVKQYAVRNWSFFGLEQALSHTSPLAIIILESVVPIILLLISPRLGVIVTIAVYGMISLTDALVVTLCVIVPALAFLRQEDWDDLRASPKMPCLIWCSLLLVWLPVSSAHYKGTRPWFQPALYQSLLLFILTVLIWILVKELVCKLRDRRRFCSIILVRELISSIAQGGPVLLPCNFRGCLVVVAWIMLLSFNGFSPYLGIKFNYSFAMLSNLRVDDSRWNHIFVPKWVRLTKHDGFIHVLFVEITNLNYGITPQTTAGRRLKPGLFSPQAFHDILNQDIQIKDNIELKILLEYKGEAFDYAGNLAESGFDAFRAQLPPPKGHWLHDFLAPDGPMGCKH